MPHEHSGKSAVWAAQRVGADQIAVVANSFIIDVIDFDDTDRFRYSSNVVSYAVENGWWNPNTTITKFSFYHAYANHDDLPSYVSSRIHRVYELVAPSIKLTPFYTDLMAYPFSVRPDAALSHADTLRLLRDQFNGSKYFDLTAQAVAPGPFGNPNRWTVSNVLSG